jgi:hypothetical protein
MAQCKTLLNPLLLSRSILFLALIVPLDKRRMQLQSLLQTPLM